MCACFINMISSSRANFITDCTISHLNFFIIGLNFIKHKVSRFVRIKNNNAQLIDFFLWLHLQKHICDFVNKKVYCTPFVIIHEYLILNYAKDLYILFYSINFIMVVWIHSSYGMFFMKTHHFYDSFFFLSANH